MIVVTIEVKKVVGKAIGQVPAQGGAKQSRSKSGNAPCPKSFNVCKDHGGGVRRTEVGFTIFIKPTESIGGLHKSPEACPGI